MASTGDSALLGREQVVQQAPGALGHAEPVRLRGQSVVGAVWAIADGQLTVSRAPGQLADCHISADPWAFVQVLYGRTGPSGRR